MTAKEELHVVLEELNDDDAERVLLMVRRLRAIAAWQGAPPDDEQTEDDRQAIAEARADGAAGNFIPWTAITRKWNELDR